MELLPANLNINFFKYTFFALLVSGVVIATGTTAWVKRGAAAYGLDFVGGTEVVASFEHPVPIDDLRSSLEKSGFESVVIQAFEKENNRFSIRVKGSEDTNAGKKVAEVLRQALPDNKLTVDKEEFVGPAVGGEIRRQSLIALSISLISILIYVSARFEWTFAVGAIVAVFHDVVVAATMVALCNYQFTMGVVAALMTITGYSVNDTIVIYDRVRENLAIREKDRAKKGGLSGMGLREIMNLSLNQTLSRTLLTSMTVFFSVTILWLIGGPGLEDFAFTLVIGTVAGTYSTIFIACPTVMFFVRPSTTQA